MRRSRISLGVALALILTVFLAGCTRPDEGSSSLRTLNIGATAEPSGLDMTTVSGAGTPYVLLYNVYETLVKLDGEGEIRPLLATDWDLSPDRLTYTFTLDKGARFSSGGRVDADAVVASFERSRSDKATEQIRSKWKVVDTIKATSDETVEVKLTKPSNDWLFHLTGSAGIIVDPEGADGLDKKPAGSGPYLFEEWEPGSHIKLSGNESYWGTPPRFGDVYFRYYTDPNAMVAAMGSGQLDIVSNLTVPQALGQFSDKSRYNVYEGSTNGEVVLGFNHRNKALSDVRVRQAINHAINRKGLRDAAWGGKGGLIGSMVPPTDPWYEDLSNTYSYDPKRARALLAQAGYADGLTLRLRVPTLPYGQPSGRYIVSALKEVGITVKFEEVEFAVWLDQVYGKHDYDMTVVAHVEPRDLNTFADPNYYWGYNNTTFQQLLAKADAASSEDQIKLLKQAAKLLADDAAADWLFLLPNIVVTKPEISGVQANQVSMSFDVTTLAARS